MASKTFRITIGRHELAGVLELPFDPRTVFGKARAPVTVTVNGYTYLSTVAWMGGPPFVPFRRSHREAAGVTEGRPVTVTISLDTARRAVRPPADLSRALKAAPPAWDRWKEMSYTHQREYAESIEEAKKPETRQRRLAGAVAAIAARPARRSSRRTS